MPDTIRKLDYYYVTISDKAGEGARLFSALRDAGVNLLAVHAFPSPRRSQIAVVPSDAGAFLNAFKAAAVKAARTARKWAQTAAREADRLLKEAQKRAESEQRQRRIKAALRRTGKVLKAAGRAAIVAGIAAGIASARGNYGTRGKKGKR